MADNTIGKGQRGVIPGLQTGEAIQPPQTQDAGRAGQVVVPRQIDINDLPRHADLAGQASPIGDLVKKSLAKLGDQRYGGTAPTTMQLLIGTLGASAAQAKSADVADQAVRELRATFSSVLRGAVEVTPERLRMIKDDAPQLIQLAVKAMDDGKSSAQEIIDGARELGASFSKVFDMAPEDRKAFIAKRLDDMGAERARFEQGAGALEAAKVNVLDRIDALTSIFKTLEKYVAFPQIPS